MISTAIKWRSKYDNHYLEMSFGPMYWVIVSGKNLTMSCVQFSSETLETVYTASYTRIYLQPWEHQIRLQRNGIHPDVFEDKIQGLHQSNTSYLF